MIRTKDLISFLSHGLHNLDYTNKKTCDMYVEYEAEIVARLRAYDKLKESIEKLCRDLSNGVDREE